eukprot:CAMPEP_0184431316 /NCGR_PEP_ID=MMETSP0738-20130409/307353_1 /TAXON_ID=385413 /ORGANISM="Thalassiosira miniscula, Strain CCMP1093" /LENGTH=58 /DNA_ID=CAMNT_0026796205 /DNA_START=42 /DNA_END=214 /DNA_ORIENTATION=+
MSPAVTTESTQNPDQIKDRPAKSMRRKKLLIVMVADIINSARATMPAPVTQRQRREPA